MHRGLARGPSRHSRARRRCSLKLVRAPCAGDRPRHCVREPGALSRSATRLRRSGDVPQRRRRRWSRRRPRALLRVPGPSKAGHGRRLTRRRRGEGRSAIAGWPRCSRRMPQDRPCRPRRPRAPARAIAEYVAGGARRSPIAPSTGSNLGNRLPAAAPSRPKRSRISAAIARDPTFIPAYVNLARFIERVRRREDETALVLRRGD